MKKDLISTADLTTREVWQLIERALKIKRGNSQPLLAGRTLAMLFQKPSLRTRVSFEVGMRQMGGHAIYLSPQEVGLGSREGIADVARVLSRYVDGIVARTFRHADVVGLARHASVPVINGLSDEEHPCQALADLLTIYEKKGKLEGTRIAFVGDGNNVAFSLALGAVLVGASFTLAAPKGYEFKEPTIEAIRGLASRNGAAVDMSNNPKAAVKGTDVVYTDVWTSMGQEEEADQRRTDFAGFRVAPELMALANKDALFMHPLPAHHGEEIAEGMLEHPQSVVYDQAENRLHIQKAILAELLRTGRG
ncbi:MAG: ornithine carbamoyltransferase [Dehalococcoidia bacterium]